MKRISVVGVTGSGKQTTQRLATNHIELDDIHHLPAGRRDRPAWSHGQLVRLRSPSDAQEWLTGLDLAG